MSTPYVSGHEYGVDTTPKFPITITSDCGTPATLRANTREPIAFENDFFKGQVLLKLKSTPPDPFYGPYFDGKKREFELQVQGRFKSPVRGQLFLALEAPRKPSLGFTMRNLVRLLLRVVKMVAGNMHCSLGTDRDEELPHVAFSLSQSVDRFIVTPPGEEPPPMGVAMFPGSSEEYKRRKRDPSYQNYAFDCTSTYSFSFHAMGIDFLTWKAVNIPGLSDLDLKAIWGDMPIRVVAYEVPAGAKTHVVSQKRYLFAFSIAHTGGKVELVREPKPSERLATPPPAPPPRPAPAEPVDLHESAPPSSRTPPPPEPREQMREELPARRPAPEEEPAVIPQLTLPTRQAAPSSSSAAPEGKRRHSHRGHRSPRVNRGLDEEDSEYSSASIEGDAEEWELQLFTEGEEPDPVMDSLPPSLPPSIGSELKRMLEPLGFVGADGSYDWKRGSRGSRDFSSFFAPDDGPRGSAGHIASPRGPPAWSAASLPQTSRTSAAAPASGDGGWGSRATRPSRSRDASPAAAAVDRRAASPVTVGSGSPGGGSSASAAPAAASAPRTLTPARSAASLAAAAQNAASLSSLPVMHVDSREVDAPRSAVDSAARTRVHSLSAIPRRLSGSGDAIRERDRRVTDVYDVGGDSSDRSNDSLSPRPATLEGSPKPAYRTTSVIGTTNAVRTGYLKKQGQTHKSWKKRLFLLDGTGSLYYYKSEKDNKPTGSLSVLGHLVGEGTIDSKREHCFFLTEQGARTYWLQATSREEMRAWIDAFVATAGCAETSPGDATVWTENPKERKAREKAEKEAEKTRLKAEKAAEKERKRAASGK